MTTQALALRAHIAQGEFFRNNTPDQWLPYIWEAFETLPARVDTLLAAGAPNAAEYAVLNAEHFTRCIDHATFSRNVLALGELEVIEVAS